MANSLNEATFLIKINGKVQTISGVKANSILLDKWDGYDKSYIPKDKEGIKYRKLDAGIWFIEETDPTGGAKEVEDDAKDPRKNIGIDSEEKKNKIWISAERTNVVPKTPGKDPFVVSLLGQLGIENSSVVGLPRQFKDWFLRSQAASIQSSIKEKVSAIIPYALGSLKFSRAKEVARNQKKRLKLLSYMDRKIDAPALITVLKKLDDKSDAEAEATRARELLENNTNNLTAEEIQNAEQAIQDSLDEEEVVYQTDRFFLQNISRPNSEKFQVVETFGEPAIIFYDKRIKIYSFSGTLPNMKNVYWRDEFYDAYNKYLRGTKVAENNYRVLLTFDDIILEGALLQLQINQDAPNFASTTMKFNMYVKSETILSLDKIRIVNEKAGINPETGV